MDGERERLAEENADLRDVLKRYLDGVSVNDEIVRESLPGGQGNTLMVVNGAPRCCGGRRLGWSASARRSGEMAALRMQDTARLEVTGRSDVQAEEAREVEVMVRSY